MPAEGARPRWSPMVVPEPTGAGEHPGLTGDRAARSTPAGFTHEGPTDEGPTDEGAPSSTSSTDEGSAGEVARRALERSLEILVEHEPKPAPGSDPTHVHQARVATRRLRSDLRTFRGLFDAAWAQDLRDELRWLGRVLGDARDADVLYERLLGRLDELPLPDRAGAEPLLERVHAARLRAGVTLATTLEGDRYAALRSRLLAAVRDPRFSERAAEPARDVLPALARRPWRRLRRRVASLGVDPSDAALHEVRIAAKRCRYAVSAVAPVMGEKAERFARALARVQDRLGEHQDAVLAEAWLRGAAMSAEAHPAFVAGELAAIERRGARAARDRWRPAWRAARKAARRARLR